MDAGVELQIAAEELREDTIVFRYSMPHTITHMYTCTCAHEHTLMHTHTDAHTHNTHVRHVDLTCLQHMQTFMGVP